MPVPTDRRWAVQVTSDSHNPARSFAMVAGLIIEQLEGEWVLSTQAWDAIETSTEVWQLADASVELVNHALSLSSNGLASVSLGTALWERCEGNPNELRHARINVGLAEILLDPIESGQATDRRPLGDRIAALARRDHHFSSAIAVLARAGLDLPALWVVFEHIETHVGGENKLREKGWITRAGHRPFAETVDRIRHYRPTLPAPSQPMSSRQCRAYVRNLLMRWLDEEEPT